MFETKLDANETAFFKRQLEQIKSNSYDVKYKELKFRKLIPISNELDPGAEFVTYEQYDKTGVAKIVESYAKDFPRVDVLKKEFSHRIKSIGDSYGYSVQEIRNAQFARKPLTPKRRMAAQRAIEQKHNKVMINGDAANGLQGLLNLANVPLVTLATPGAWSTKTPDQIIADLNKLANNAALITGGVESSNVLLLPIEEFTTLSSTPRSNNSDTTILDYFLKANPFIEEIDWLDELKDAGVGSVKRAMVYRRDEMALEGEIPQEFEEFAPEPNKMEFEIACHARTGGVSMYYPLTAAYMDGF